MRLVNQTTQEIVEKVAAIYELPGLLMLEVENRGLAAEIENQLSRLTDRAHSISDSEPEVSYTDFATQVYQLGSPIGIILGRLRIFQEEHPVSSEKQAFAANLSILQKRVSDLHQLHIHLMEIAGISE